MYRGSYIIVLLVTVLLAVACSGGNSSPLSPGLTNPAMTNPTAQSTYKGSPKSYWGLWDISIDTDTWEAEIVPIRGPQFTVDVVTFLQPPVGSPANLQLIVTDVSEWLTQGLITCDVGLRHPFPGLDQYTGFDVYGVFMAPGAITGQYDSDVVYTDGIDNSILLNADGYTRWMNPVEFPDTGTILDFTAGKLGTQDIGLFTSTINGYKYYADGIEKDQSVADFLAEPGTTDFRGTFRPGSFNEREYQMKFPMVGGSPTLVFQYAVVASWFEPDLTLGGEPDALDVPDDWHLSANADEAIFIEVTDNSTLYYQDDVGGGNIVLDLEIFDWGSLQNSMGVAGEIGKIVLEGDSNVIPGGFAEYPLATIAATAAPGTTAISSVFHVELTGCTPESSDDLPVLITVESAEPTTFDVGSGVPNNDDTLAGYFMADLAVDGEAPFGIQVLTPNGGETLWQAMSYEITWDPGPASVTDVMIEWSTDGFVSDIREIVASTPNDGSYTWMPIPVEDVTTGRVRISDVLATDSDTSDGDFSIELPVWLGFEDVFIPDTGNVTWGWYFTYDHTQDEISPGIMQTTTGVVYIGFYGTGVGSLSNDMMVRTTDGTSWYGSGGFWSTSGTNTGRADYLKVCPSHNGFGWMCTSLWGYGWWASIACGNGTSSLYSFDGPRFNYTYPKYFELATDAAGYIFAFGDNNTNGIYWCKSNQPGLTGAGGAGQVTAVTQLLSDGIISKSRSWARQGDALALIYTTGGGEIHLAETTDAPTNNVWDYSEVVWNLGTDYQLAHTPCLAEDSNGRLFAAWVAQLNSGDWQILASMRETPSDPWTDAVVVYSGNGSDEPSDVHISSQVVSLPSGTDEDVAVVGWLENGIVKSALSPLDMMAFLPLQDVSDTGSTADSPDVMCIDDSWGFANDILFAYSVEDGNWDIAAHRADFETP